MSNEIRSIVRPDVRDQILGQLMELIATGRFRQGTRLPTERRLCEQFNVSRPSLREAIGILASQGFVNVRRGSGTYVNPPESWNTLDPIVLLARGKEVALRELMDVRERLEPYVAYLAAQNADAGDIATIENALQRPDTVDEYVKTDITLHSALAKATHNQVLLIMLHSVQEIQIEVFRTGEIVAKTFDQHCRIVQKVKERDAEGAYAAMEEHLRDSRQHHLAALAGSRSPST